MPKLRICQLCNQLKAIEARGLCRQCYGLMQRNGELHKFTKDQSTTFGLEDEITKSYSNGIPVLEIAKKYNVSKNTIYRSLDREGYNRENRKYKIDESVFNSLDNEFAAYWLGFIYADGYVHPVRGYLSVGLQQRDENHLVKLRDFLGSDAPIKTYNYTGYPQSRLSISSKELAVKLRGLGILVGRNRFNLAIAKLPDWAYRHLVRGLVDGDGYVCENNRTPVVRVLGQDDILDWVNEIAVDYLSLARQTKIPIKGDNDISTISFAGRLQAIKFGSWLYDDAQVFMPRKRNRYLSWNREQSTKGENNGNSKLKWSQVNEMRELWSTGKYSKASLGRMFGVTPRMVLLIVNNEVWKING